MQLVLLLRVHFLLELLTVAQRVVHVVIDDTGEALVVTQVLLVVLHAKHYFRFCRKVMAVIVHVRFCIL